eukprot:364912-Chlamydomonas_euryale.AAC.6
MRRQEARRIYLVSYGCRSYTAGATCRRYTAGATCIHLYRATLYSHMWTAVSLISDTHVAAAVSHQHQRLQFQLQHTQTLSAEPAWAVAAHWPLKRNTCVHAEHLAPRAASTATRGAHACIDVVKGDVELDCCLSTAPRVNPG